MTKTVIQIVREHLKSNGFDGLVQSYAECGCLLDDLAPCCDNISHCKPGYRIDDSESPGGWLVSTKKPTESQP